MPHIVACCKCDTPTLPLLDNASLLLQELQVYTVPDPSQIPHTWIIIFNNNGHIPISFFFFFFIHHHHHHHHHQKKKTADFTSFFLCWLNQQGFFCTYKKAITSSCGQCVLVDRASGWRGRKGQSI
ncbi:hypothetical protein CY35_15G022200 [Sphagnum magellanicum]|nr:hypothetical protein CY35_15G022200 [Sphagnum magellanicum]